MIDQDVPRKSIVPVQRQDIGTKRKIPMAILVTKAMNGKVARVPISKMHGGVVVGNHNVELGSPLTDVRSDTVSIKGCLASDAYMLFSYKCD